MVHDLQYILGELNFFFLIEKRLAYDIKKYCVLLFLKYTILYFKANSKSAVLIYSCEYQSSNSIFNLPGLHFEMTCF